MNEQHITAIAGTDAAPAIRIGSQWIRVVETSAGWVSERSDDGTTWVYPSRVMRDRDEAAWSAVISAGYFAAAINSRRLFAIVDSAGRVVRAYPYAVRGLADREVGAYPRGHRVVEVSP